MKNVLFIKINKINNTKLFILLREHVNQTKISFTKKKIITEFNYTTINKAVLIYPFDEFKNNNSSFFVD